MSGHSILSESSDTISRVIHEVVASVLKDVEVEINDIRVEDGLDEDVKIVVVLTYSSDAKVTGAMLNDLTYKARKKLVELGDIRYPFFDHTFPDTFKNAV